MKSHAEAFDAGWSRATEPSKRRLTITLCSSDHAHHHSLSSEIMKRARHEGMAGATVIQAADGTARSGASRHPHLFTEDVTLAILIVDTEAKIDAFVAGIADVIGDAFVVIDTLHAFRA